MIMIILWVVLMVCVSFVASRKNMSGGFWMLLSLAITPIVSLIIMAFMKKRELAS